MGEPFKRHAQDGTSAFVCETKEKVRWEALF